MTYDPEFGFHIRSFIEEHKTKSEEFIEEFPDSQLIEIYKAVDKLLGHVDCLLSDYENCFEEERKNRTKKIIMEILEEISKTYQALLDRDEINN